MTDDFRKFGDLGRYLWFTVKCLENKGDPVHRFVKKAVPSPALLTQGLAVIRGEHHINRSGDAAFDEFKEGFEEIISVQEAVIIGVHGIAAFSLGPNQLFKILGESFLIRAVASPLVQNDKVGGVEVDPFKLRDQGVVVCLGEFTRVFDGIHCLQHFDAVRTEIIDNVLHAVSGLGAQEISLHAARFGHSIKAPRAGHHVVHLFRSGEHVEQIGNRHIRGNRRRNRFSKIKPVPADLGVKKRCGFPTVPKYTHMMITNALADNENHIAFD